LIHPVDARNNLVRVRCGRIWLEWQQSELALDRVAAGLKYRLLNDINTPPLFRKRFDLLNEDELDILNDLAILSQDADNQSEHLAELYES